jgi:ribonuclease HI
MAIYHMWLARNEARDEQLIEDPEATARRVLALQEEWTSLNVSPAKQARGGEEKWVPPKDGWHKVNSDGAFSSALGHGGGGVIVRDHHGVALAGACHFFPQVIDPERAELLACRCALQLAKDVGVRRLVLENDCAGAVGKLNQASLDRSGHGPLVEEIKALLGGFEKSSVIHVRRRCNGIAHYLAKEGRNNKYSKTWLGVFPVDVMNLLALDSGV